MVEKGHKPFSWKIWVSLAIAAAFLAICLITTIPPALKLQSEPVVQATLFPTEKITSTPYQQLTILVTETSESPGIQPQTVLPIASSCTPEQSVSDDYYPWIMLQITDNTYSVTEDGQTYYYDGGVIMNTLTNEQAVVMCMDPQLKQVPVCSRYHRIDTVTTNGSLMYTFTPKEEGLQRFMYVK